MAKALSHDKEYKEKRYVTAADAYRVGSVRNLAEGEAAGLERVTQRAYAGLRLAMGIDQQMSIQIADEHLMAGKKNLDANSLLSQAIARRPDLAKAEIGAKAAALEQQLARAAYYPDVGAYASFSNVWDDGHFANPTHPNEGAVGFEVQLPLFEGGRRIAEAHRVECQQAQATQIRRLLADLVSQEVQDAYLEFLESSKQLDWNQEAVHQGNLAMDDLFNQNGQIEDRNMSKYFEDVVLTRLMLTQALVKYYQSVYNSNLSLARIRFVTACDEYETYLESGGSDAHLRDVCRRSADDARR